MIIIIIFFKYNYTKTNKIEYNTKFLYNYIYSIKIYIKDLISYLIWRRSYSFSKYNLS